MRLSDIKGDRVFDVIADIIDPIANIASDETASALFKREKLPEGMTAKAFLLERARKAIPALLKGHKSDIITVLATIEGVSSKEYRASLTLAKLMQLPGPVAAVALRCFAETGLLEPYGEMDPVMHLVLREHHGKVDLYDAPTMSQIRNLLRALQ